MFRNCRQSCKEREKTKGVRSILFFVPLPLHVLRLEVFDGENVGMVVSHITITTIIAQDIIKLNYHS